MDKENEEVKRAEIIYIDATEEPEDTGRKGYEQQRYWSAIGDLKNAKFPVGLRVFGFFIGLVMTLVAAIAFAITLIWLAVSFLALRQSTEFNARVSSFWKSTCKMSMIAFGGFLTVFNPALGIGLVILYFMMRGEEMNEMLFHRFTSYNPHQN